MKELTNKKRIVYVLYMHKNTDPRVSEEVRTRMYNSSTFLFFVFVLFEVKTAVDETRSERE